MRDAVIYYRIVEPFNNYDVDWTLCPDGYIYKCEWLIGFFISRAYESHPETGEYLITLNDMRDALGIAIDSVNEYDFKNMPQNGLLSTETIAETIKKLGDILAQALSLEYYLHEKYEYKIIDLR